MMLITPQVEERLASLDIDTKIKHSIDRVKALLTVPSSQLTTSRQVQSNKHKGSSKSTVTFASDNAVANEMARALSKPESYNRLHTSDGTLKRFTQDMEPVSNEPYKLGATNLLGDNKSVTFTAKNPLTSTKSRWLDVRWFRLREFVKAGFVRISHIFTQQNVADFFTKPLQAESFLRMRRFLMNN